MHPDLIKLLDLQARDVELLEVNGRLFVPAEGGGWTEGLLYP